MWNEIVPNLICPACSQQGLSIQIISQDQKGHVTDAIVWCSHCRNWYPLENGVLELLVGKLAYHKERKVFAKRYLRELDALELGNDQSDSTYASDLQSVQQHHFDWYANNDTQTYTSYENTPFWLGVDKITFDKWKRQIMPNHWLLDIGCAQGRSTFKGMDLPLSIVGFDISKRLVEQAAERYRQGNYPARAVFLVADAEHQIPFCDQTFDYVLIYGVLHHLPHPDATCREVKRVLKFGGTYFGSENNRSVFRGIFDFLQSLNPLWHEEAGPQALLSRQEFSSWFGSDVQVKIQTRVFIPPHLANLLSKQNAYRLLRFTDSVGQAIPLLRDSGGLIVVEVAKVVPPVIAAR